MEAFLKSFFAYEKWGENDIITVSQPQFNSQSQELKNAD